MDSFLGTQRKLIFSDRYEQNNAETFLFELNDEIIADLEKNKHCFIKGSERDEALLVTSSKTYRMRKSETSNILKLTKVGKKVNPETAMKIESSKTFHYEFIEATEPRHQIRTLLQEQLYPGNGEFIPITLQDFALRTQVSEETTVETLNDLNAVQIDAGYVIVDPIFRMEMNKKMLEWILTEESLRCQDIHGDTLEGELQSNDNIQYDILKIKSKLNEEGLDFHEGIVEACLKDIGEISHHRLILGDKKCKRYGALMIFQENDSPTFDDFILAWGRVMEIFFPEHCRPTGDITDELALLNKMTVTYEANSTTKTMGIKYVDEDQLPHTFQTRLKELFLIKKHWRLEELTPFLESVCPPKQRLDQTLIKHTRAITQRDNNGKAIRLYGPKF